MLLSSDPPQRDSKTIRASSKIREIPRHPHPGPNWPTTPRHERLADRRLLDKKPESPLSHPRFQRNLRRRLDPACHSLA